mmetsp:Transcript_28979/g.71156  ORF Transcript_28979/g.71156 Transcript_28979/m.71156 type:complete len:87 (+) Transcript_28979:668-928(+)
MVPLVMQRKQHKCLAPSQSDILASLSRTRDIGFGPGAPMTLERMAFANGEQDNTKYRAAAVGNLVETLTAVAKCILPEERKGEMGT